jgi:hypothetical protein
MLYDRLDVRNCLLDWTDAMKYVLTHIDNRDPDLGRGRPDEPKYVRST